jgi:hypothetical protein
VAERVIDNLEERLKISGPVAPETIGTFRMLMESREFLQSRGASIKLILENLALNLPKVR